MCSSICSSSCRAGSNIIQHLLYRCTDMTLYGVRMLMLMLMLIMLIKNIKRNTTGYFVFLSGPLTALHRALSPARSRVTKFSVI